MVPSLTIQPLVENADWEIASKTKG
jgi:LytS/YehU family sensor histidine kinase